MHTKCKIETFATRMDATDHPDPWELRESDEMDARDAAMQQSAIDCKRDELATKQRQFIIHAVGLAAFIGGGAVAVAMGQTGFTLFTLMTIAMLCMDRS